MRLAHLILIVIVSGLMVPSVFAGNDPPLEFDLSAHDTSIVVWLDMSVILTSDRVRKLEDGVELGLQYDIELVKPKRFWGQTVCYAQHQSWLVGYKIVTDEYFLEIPIGSDSTRIITFESLARLHRHLADSVIIPLAPRGCNNSGERYVLRVKITVISLTSTNFALAPESHSESNSALQLLFRSFLDITGHGRTELRVVSEPFSLSDLTIKE